MADHGCEEETVAPGSTLFFLYMFSAMFLVCFAGMMSGLTLGLLSMDQLELKLLIAAGTPKEQKFAKKILPLIEKEHLLLVTLLLFNALAMEALPIVLDKMVSSYLAIIISVTAVLLFGEVIPQGVCSRYGLYIGAFMSPFVRVLIFLAYPIAWPVAKLLDCILGTGHAGFFRRHEFKELVRLHGQEHAITGDEATIMRGALELRDKTAKQIMTPIESVFMVDGARKFDEKCLDEMLQRRHSRIPVYEREKKNVVGLIIVKTLLKHAQFAFMPVESQITVSELPRREFLEIAANTPLDSLLNQFQLGKSHLGLVYEGTDLLGIVTLEDVLEELIAEEIVDETDEYVDVHKKIRVVRAIQEIKSVARKPLVHGNSSSQLQRGWKKATAQTGNVAIEMGVMNTDPNTGSKEDSGSGQLLADRDDLEDVDAPSIRR
jgi:ankyrin repeat/SOCS box protein 13/metal transporter CNNM